MRPEAGPGTGDLSCEFSGEPYTKSMVSSDYFLSVSYSLALICFNSLTLFLLLPYNSFISFKIVSESSL